MVAASHTLAVLALAASQAMLASAWVIEPDNMPPIGASKISLAAADPNMVGVAPVFGFPNCDFSMGISIGGQTVKLILDTGSSNNAVAGSACAQCTTDGLKTLYTDKSGQAQTNAINPHYGDGSFFNAYITNKIATTVPGGSGSAATLPAPADIAVMTSESMFFRGACAAFNQGILGLAYQRLALNAEVPYPDSLAAAGAPNGIAFQLCAISNNVSPTQRVGSMYLGGYPSSQLAAPMVYTPVKTIGYYEVTFSAMLMGTTNLNLNNLATDRHIVDSGTTGFLLPSDNYQKVIAAIQAANPLTLVGATAAQSATALTNLINGQALSVAATAVQLSTAASATLFVAMPDAKNPGKTIQVPIRPMDYIFVTAPDTAGKVTMEFLIFNIGVASGSGGVTTIMGHPIHMNKVVFYDRVNNQVGFANAVPCQYTAVQGDVVSVTADKIDMLAGGVTRAAAGTTTGTTTGTTATTAKASPSASPSAKAAKASPVAKASPSTSPSTKPKNAKASPSVSPKVNAATGTATGAVTGTTTGTATGTATGTTTGSTTGTTTGSTTGSTTGTAAGSTTGTTTGSTTGTTTGSTTGTATGAAATKNAAMTTAANVPAISLMVAAAYFFMNM